MSSIPNQFSRKCSHGCVCIESESHQIEPPGSTSKSPLEGDDWGLSDFVAPQPQSISQKKPTKSLWDIDDFDSSSPSDPQLLPRSHTPGDFDFGDHEDGLLRSHSDDGNDEILGDLGRPVDVVRASSQVCH